MRSGFVTGSKAWQIFRNIVNNMAIFLLLGKSSVNVTLPSWRTTFVAMFLAFEIYSGPGQYLEGRVPGVCRYESVRAVAIKAALSQLLLWQPNATLRHMSSINTVFKMFVESFQTITYKTQKTYASKNMILPCHQHSLRLAAFSDLGQNPHPNNYYVVGQEIAVEDSGGSHGRRGLGKIVALFGRAGVVTHSVERV